MDIVRFILIFLIAGTAYYLLLQWPPIETVHSTNEISPLYEELESSSKDSLSPLQPPALSSPDPEVVSSKRVSSFKSFFVENDVLKLKIEGETGAVNSAVLKKVKRNAFGEDSLDFLSSEPSRSYFLNSGFFLNSGAFIKPKFLSMKESTTSEGWKSYSLRGEDEGLGFERLVILKPELYSVTVTDKVVAKNISGPTTITPYAIINRDGFAVKGDAFAYDYLGPVFSTQEERFEKISFEDLAEESFKKSSPGGWSALIQHYFLSAWVPDQSKTFLFQARKNSNNRFSVVYTEAPVTLEKQGDTASSSNTLYVGPKLAKQLDKLHPDLDLVLDYGFLWWLGVPIYWLLGFGYEIFQNWGVAIIFLTIMLKLLLWPLSASAYRSMGKMRTLTPKLQALQAQHGDDKQKMGQAMMELYKKEGVNPLGGCLPMLAQMPFFLAFYWVLVETVELRHSPFVFWITDLSSKDPLFVLPILNAAGMYYSQKLTPTPPNADPMQAQMMKYFPLVFALIFAWFPAGLVLYWLVNMLVTLLQQWWYYRKEGGSVFSSEG